jgi:glutamate formiminotransferase
MTPVRRIRIIKARKLLILGNLNLFLFNVKAAREITKRSVRYMVGER